MKAFAQRGLHIGLGGAVRLAEDPAEGITRDPAADPAEGTLDMALIQRMILRRLVQRMALAFAMVGVIGVATQILRHVAEIVDSASGAMPVVRMFVLLLPMVAVVILPVALLVALAQTFDGLDEAMETAAVRASGAGPLFLVAPALWLGAGVAAPVLATSLWLEPAAHRGLPGTMGALKMDALGVFATEGVFRQVEPDLFVHGGKKGADGWIDGLFLLDRRDPDRESLTLARAARLVRDGGVPVIEMVDGSVARRDAAGREVLRLGFGRFTMAAQQLFSDLPPRHALAQRFRADRAVWTCTGWQVVGVTALQASVDGAPPALDLDPAL